MPRRVGRAAPDGEVRAFGGVVLVGLALAGWRAHRRGAPAWVAAGLAITGAALALAAAVAPAAVRPLYARWMALGRSLGRVTTPVLLALAFGLVLVPSRWILALAGIDLLGRRFDRAARSYWVERRRSRFGREDFERLW